MDDGYQRLYLASGKVVHLLSSLASPNSYRAARCGASPSWWAQGWCGTGSQDEIDKVASLPECGRCRRLVNRDAEQVAAMKAELKSKTGVVDI